MASKLECFWTIGNKSFSLILHSLPLVFISFESTTGMEAFTWRARCCYYSTSIIASQLLASSVIQIQIIIMNNHIIRKSTVQVFLFSRRIWQDNFASLSTCHFFIIPTMFCANYEYKTSLSPTKFIKTACSDVLVIISTSGVWNCFLLLDNSSCVSIEYCIWRAQNDLLEFNP